MRRLSFSLAGLLAFTLVVAFWCAAFRYKTDLWASATVSLSGLLLLLGTLAALLRPAGRPFWIGFAVFGLAYFWVSLGGSDGIWPQLITSHLIDAFQADADAKTADAIGIDISSVQLKWTSLGASRIGFLPNGTQSIGHSGIAIIIALFGGAAGCLIRGRSSPPIS